MNLPPKLRTNMSFKRKCPAQIKIPCFDLLEGVPVSPITPIERWQPSINPVFRSLKSPPEVPKIVIDITEPDCSAKGCPSSCSVSPTWIIISNDPSDSNDLPSTVTAEESKSNGLIFCCFAGPKGLFLFYMKKVF